jgi:hypothetical protein
MWLLKKRYHNMRSLTILSSHFRPGQPCKEEGGLQLSGQAQIGESGAVVVGGGLREAAKHDVRDAAG